MIRGSDSSIINQPVISPNFQHTCSRTNSSVTSGLDRFIVFKFIKVRAGKLTKIVHTNTPPKTKNLCKCGRISFLDIEILPCRCSSKEVEVIIPRDLQKKHHAPIRPTADNHNAGRSENDAEWPYFAHGSA